ncbi:VOC family protein [Pseudoalteromonas sp. CnMc7-15]|uniref:VOC family protein n=1 Tax=unclassified Pseudoalteromonas TaxID=194690 RepID=UPI001EF49DDA|nr:MULTISPECIES: VOC family protein [unclassified Pseudoalteromonas]MCG7565787.1 VOC family protein [Pseudoalteromonas sp. CnMc7-15]MCG7569407.1 VOC family protein [Pseudoalteromonas sp. CNC9-20]
MENNCILLPVSDLEKADYYYEKILGFKILEDYYKTPEGFGDSPLFLLAQNFKGENVLQNDRPKLFRLHYTGDILQLCKLYTEKNVDILTFSEYPGGYYMLIQDPFNNKFEILADFLKKEQTIDPSKWSFFNRI